VSLFGNDGVLEPVERLELDLLDPCTTCGARGKRVAEFYRFARPQRIGVRCPPPCEKSYWLSLDKYGHHFGIVRKRKGARGKDREPNDALILARYNWCCVYHEGSREAREYKIAQLRGAGLINVDAATSSGIDELQEIVERSAREMFSVSSGNLFGLERDHLIPIWVQDRVELDDEERALAGREWIVVGCQKCNSDRKIQLESTDQLLYLYSRFLMPFRGATEFERLNDLLTFVSVLRKIEDHHRCNAGEGPLTPRSARLAT
jgi:hypothetical protein